MPLYSRKSPRCVGYDYTLAGMYFVTICTKNREHYFGEIKNGVMFMNEIGKSCYREISSISEKREDAGIDEFVVMPNHVHIIIIIGEGNCRDGHLGHPQNEIWKPVSLGQVVNIMKGSVTKYTKQNNLSFARQSRYHDHIIREENEYITIKQYIQNNPQEWLKDTFNKDTAKRI